MTQRDFNVRWTEGGSAEAGGSVAGIAITSLSLIGVLTTSLSLSRRRVAGAVGSVTS